MPWPSQLVQDANANVAAVDAAAYKTAASISSGQEAIVKTGMVIAAIVAASLILKKG